MAYLNTQSGLGGFLDSLNGQINARVANNDQLRGLAAGGVIPASMSPGPSFFDQLRSGLGLGGPQQPPAAPMSAPQAPMAPMAPSAPPAGPVASAAPSSPGPLPTFAAGVGTPSSLSPNAQTALSFYQSKGLPPVAAAALVGGFSNESGPGLSTTALNRGDGTDGSNSVGIAQWNGGRAAALRAFAAQNGLNPNDINTQLQFSWAELNGPERATLDRLQAAGNNPLHATAAAVGYERPAGWTPDNPFGAKTFGSRLASTVALAQMPGSANIPGAPGGGFGPLSPTGQPLTPAQQGGNLGASSAMGGMNMSQAPAYGALDRNAFASNAPQLPMARAQNTPSPPQGGSMGASAAGAPQPIDPNGNALGYAPPGASAAPASRAISGAAPAAGAPYGSVPVNIGGKMLTRQQAEDTDGLDHTDYDAAAAKLGMSPTPFVEGGPSALLAPASASAPAAATPPVQMATAPGVANAQSPQAPLQQAPNPAAAAASQFALSKEQIQALLANPATRAMGWQAWQQAATGKNFGFMTGPDGTILRTDPTTGAVTPVYQGQKQVDFQHFAGKDGSEYAFNPRTASTTKLSDGGPGTTVIPTDQAIARGIVPSGFTGVVQSDSDGKISISAAPTAATTKSLAAQAQERTQIMQQQGRNLNDPAVQDFIATGKMSAPGSTHMNPTELKIYDKDTESAAQLEDGIRKLEEARDLSPSINTGFMGTFKADMAGMGAALGLTDGSPSVAATARYDNLIKTSQAQVAKASIGGRVTNYDEQFFQSLGANSKKSPAERAAIIDSQVAILKNDLARTNARLETMKSGAFSTKGAAGNAGQSPAAGAPTGPISPEDAMKLPPGTPFIGMDGQARVRH